MLQAGRIVNVHLPKDRVTQTHQGYGFVEFISEEDADYAAKIMNQVRLYGKPIRVNKASADKQKTVEIGAELFIGNLDAMVDEKILYETFSRFGSLISAPKVRCSCSMEVTETTMLTCYHAQVARDESNLSKGYGFVSFGTFEASDEAIANMNGQYLMNKEISVQYAYKKDGKGERHGDEAERMLASQAQKHNVSLPVQPLPPQLFQQPPPTGPAAVANGDARNMNGTPVGPAGFGGPPPGGPGAPPNFPPMPHHQPRGPTPSQTPLPPPPSGLPARPPPSQAGYGGPAGFMPPNFPAPPGPPGFQQPPPMGGPPGFGGPPPGFPPSVGGAAPPPPGFQNFGQRR